MRKQWRYVFLALTHRYKIPTLWFIKIKAIFYNNIKILAFCEIYSSVRLFQLGAWNSFQQEWHHWSQGFSNFVECENQSNQMCSVKSLCIQHFTTYYNINRTKGDVRCIITLHFIYKEMYTWLVLYCILLPKASFGLRVLSSPATVCVCVCVSVSVSITCSSAP